MHSTAHNELPSRLVKVLISNKFFSNTNHFLSVRRLLTSNDDRQSHYLGVRSPWDEWTLEKGGHGAIGLISEDTQTLRSMKRWHDHVLGLWNDLISFYGNRTIWINSAEDVGEGNSNAHFVERSLILFLSTNVSIKYGGSTSIQNTRSKFRSAKIPIFHAVQKCRHREYTNIINNTIWNIYWLMTAIIIVNIPNLQKG